MPGDPRHQLSYTLVAAHAGAYAGSGAGWGDVILNYRYQLVGNGDTRTAFSPRLSVLLPSGDETQGRGFGATGIQASFPLSVVLHPRLVSHWNAGTTFVSKARDALHNRANTVGYNLGQSLIWMAHPRFNVMMETVYASAQSVVAPDQTQWTRLLYVSPGIVQLQERPANRTRDCRPARRGSERRRKRSLCLFKLRAPVRQGAVQVAKLRARARFTYVAGSSSGSTLVSPVVLMKLASPVQRGTTCIWI
jgi:hypothetical protein